MKFFTKAALISAMAISTSAMAAQMQSLDDEALSATTGQDGISITLNTTAAGIDIAKLYIHDNDGLAPAGAPGDAGFGGTGEAGAIGISNLNISSVDNNGAAIAGALATVKIDTDAGTNGDEPFLNVGVNLGNIKISLDDITVGVSGDKSAMTGATRGATDEVVILSGYDGAANPLSVTLGSSDLVIQLGHAPQGAMIKASGTVTGGVRLANVAINDAVGGGSIGIDNIIITDAGSANLTVDTSISATIDGLQIISGSNAHNIYLDQVRLGDLAGMASGATSAIGDIEIQGLNTNATSIIIAGH